jgi:transcriptional regulator with XRE-family HTH domain
MTSTIADISPQKALHRFEEQLGLSSAEIASAFGVSDRTLSRWRKGQAYPQHDARSTMNTLLELTDMLEDTFDSPKGIHIWVRAENRYLGGLTPADAIRVGRADRARAALEALESGIYL